MVEFGGGDTDLKVNMKFVQLDTGIRFEETGQKRQHLSSP